MGRWWVVCFLFSPAVFATSPFAEIEANILKLEQQRAQREAVEAVSYDLTSRLCYRYQFRRKYGVAVDLPTSSEDTFRRHYLKSDPDLQKSEEAWWLLTAQGFKSLFDPEAETILLFFSQSQFVSTLFKTKGYQSAAQDCSRAVGVNLLPVLDRDIRNSQIGITGVIYLGVGNGISAILRVGLKSLIRRVWGRRVTASLGSKLIWFTTTMAGGVVGAVYGVRELENLKKANQTMLANLPEDLKSSSAQPPTDVVNFRLFRFLQQFNQQFANILRNPEEIQALEQKLREDRVFREDINFFRQHLKDIIQREAKIDAELSRHPNAVLWLKEILTKRARNEPLTAGEEEFLLQAQILQGLRLVRDILSSHFVVQEIPRT